MSQQFSSIGVPGSRFCFVLSGQMCAEPLSSQHADLEVAAVDDAPQHMTVAAATITPSCRVRVVAASHVWWMRNLDIAVTSVSDLPYPPYPPYLPYLPYLP